MNFCLVCAEPIKSLGRSDENPEIWLHACRKCGILWESHEKHIDNNPIALEKSLTPLAKWEQEH